eukprot:3936872-Rhodomonas_salina.1
MIICEAPARSRPCFVSNPQKLREIRLGIWRVAVGVARRRVGSAEVGAGRGVRPTGNEGRGRPRARTLRRS